MVHSQELITMSFWKKKKVRREKQKKIEEDKKREWEKDIEENV